MSADKCAFCTTLERHGYHHPDCPGPRLDREHRERMDASMKKFREGVRQSFAEAFKQQSSEGKENG